MAGDARPAGCTDRPDDQESTLTALTALPTSVLFASSSSEGFKPPTLDEFFPSVFLFEGTPFAMNRVMLLRVIVAVVLIVVLVWYVRRSSLVPGRGAGAVETVLDLVRVSIAEQILGRTNGRRFLPLIATLFFLVFGLNILGIIPFANLAATSVIGMPLVLAVVVWLTFVVVGFQAQGPRYLTNTLFPNSVPKFIWPLYAPIEALAVFILRPATLTIRLWANMVAGHFLLVLCFKATDYLLFNAGEAALIPLSVVTLFGGFAFTLFEILVALLQAYIFALLAAIYIDSSLHAEH